jgi:pimeloyl-ACP methyl ester carboxylesterase
VHLAATLDNWDPRIIDPIAKYRHVIAFDNTGVGASTGQVPDTVEAMADDAYAFITALGLDKIDIFAFSLGGFIAQALVVKHPDLVRKLVLTGTGPKGGKDIDKVAGVTYFDILRATLTRSDPKESVQAVSIRWCGTRVDGRTLAIEQAKVETLATEIQPGVQHCVGPPFVLRGRAEHHSAGGPSSWHSLPCGPGGNW